MFWVLLLVVAASASAHEGSAKKHDSGTTTPSPKGVLTPGAAPPPKRRCVPTAVARGPCHVCECSVLGVYRCQERSCANDTIASGPLGQTAECEPGAVYEAGVRSCACDVRGAWETAACRAALRLLRTDAPLREQGVQKLPSATVLPPPPEPPGDPAPRPAAPTPSPPLTPRPAARSTCVPGEKTYRDCNLCICSAHGSYACTAKLCMKGKPHFDLNDFNRDEKAGRAAHLPELSSSRQPCAPGQRYRLGCNSCFCSKKGFPVCTNMICFDHFSDTGKGRKLAVIHAGEKCVPGMTYRLDCNVCRCSSKRHLVCTKKTCILDKAIQRAIESQHREDNNLAADEKYLDTKNNIEKDAGDFLETNTKNKNDADKNKTKLIKNNIDKEAGDVLETNSKNETDSVKKIIKLGKNKIDKEAGVALETNTKHETDVDKNKLKPKKVMKERTVNNRETEEESSKNASGKGKSYPELPKTKCKPGLIYKKGCQRCFCTNKKTAQCTNKPCEEMESAVQSPTDVHPSITPKEFQALPSLPHEAARCEAGRAYSVQCNSCLCLANGNLLCTAQLCLVVDEVNKLAAIKLKGQPCKLKPGQSSKDLTPKDKLEVDCVECSCVQGRMQCHARPGCVPQRFRRALHGQESSLKPAALDSTKEKCIPGMVYKQNCNNCYCQENRSLRCTRKGCLSYVQIQKLKQHRQRLLMQG